MPHEWNDILVVTMDELIPAYWKNLPHLQQELYRYEKKSYGIKRAQRGGNGCQLLIRFDSLRREVQDALGDPRKLNHPLDSFYQVDAKAVEFYTSFKYEADDSYILPDTQEQYIINASVAQSILKLKSARTTERLTKGGTIRGLSQSLCIDAINYNQTLKANSGVQHNLPSHPRKFIEKINQFDKIGYVAFVKDAERKGKGNVRKLTPETIQLLQSMFANRGEEFKPNATEVGQEYEGFLTGYVELINPETGEIYNRKDFKPISIRAIKGLLSSWESKIGTYARRSGNRQKLTQEFIPYHSVLQPTMSGSLISIDDRNPPFWYEKGKRVWFYIGIDLASGAVITYVHGKTKEGIIIEFYRQMVRNYAEWGFNIPIGLECESSLNSSFKDTFLRPGAMFEDVRIEANKARSKRVEAYFKPFRYQLEKKREGWIARPNALSESNQKASDKPNKIIPYDTIIEGCLRDIQTWQNMPHNKQKTISKWDYFLENQCPDTKPTDYKSILPHIGYHTKTSCHAGIIKLQEKEWLLGDEGEIYRGEKLIRLMRQVETEYIDIYWIDGNDHEVLKALIYMNGRYICEALPKPLYSRAKNERTAEGLEARKIMSAYECTISAFQRDQAISIEPIEIRDSRPLTIGTSFQIPELKKYQEVPADEEVQELGEIGREDEEDEELEYSSVPEESRGFTWRDKFQE